MFEIMKLSIYFYAIHIDNLKLQKISMKKHRFTLAAAALILSIGIGMSFLSSCEGPAGLAGTDANESCAQCHNNDGVLEGKILQASNSQHQMGTSFERNGTDCAGCHTSQGFMEVLATGSSTTASAISNPVPVGCTTCHHIHESYDSTDYALRVTEPVTLDMNGVTLDLGNANVCVTCHQPRTPNPVVDMTSTAMVTITNSRWGPHHGTQAAMIGGTAAYEVEGSVSYPSSKSAHYNAGCNTCHMAEAYGSQAGGHTFGMTYEYHGSDAIWTNGCLDCHSGIGDKVPSPDYKGTMTEVEGLLATLKTSLEDADILDEEGLVNTSSTSPISLTVDQAAALYNYYYVMEDRSMGIHNPTYTKALLQNSIEVFPV
jgi:nitrate/TMAO reductase-like tetraheme cytochrome c subunit